MTERRDEESGAKMRLKTLRCRRTGQWIGPDKHLACPYCFGKAEDLAGTYERFCDYDAEKDPVSFGFPPDQTRMLKG